MRYKVLAGYGRIGYCEIYWCATKEEAVEVSSKLEARGYVARFEEVAQ